MQPIYVIDWGLSLAKSVASLSDRIKIMFQSLLHMSKLKSKKIDRLTKIPKIDFQEEWLKLLIKLD